MAFNGPVAADAPLTVAEAKAQIEQLETDAAAIDQEYVGVQEELKAGRGFGSSGLTRDGRPSRVSQLRDQAGQVAWPSSRTTISTPRRGCCSPKTPRRSLVRSPPSTRSARTRQVCCRTSSSSRRHLANLEHSARTDVAALSDHEQKLTKLRAASDKQVTEAKSALAKLTAAERAQIAAEEAKATEEAQNEAEQGTDKTSRDSDRQPVGETAGTSGRGQATAMAFARKQLGKPYRFGAAGPARMTALG